MKVITIIIWGRGDMYNNPYLNVDFKKYRPAEIDNKSLKGSLWVQTDPHVHQFFIEGGSRVPCEVRQIIMPLEKNKLRLNFIIHQKSSKGSGLGRILAKASIYGFSPSGNREPPIGLTIFVDHEGEIGLEADLANEIIIVEKGNFIKTNLTLTDNTTCRAYEFNSYEEIPPKFKEIYHEHFEHILCNLDSKAIDKEFNELARKASRFPFKLSFLVDGMQFDNTDEIPDEEMRIKAEYMQDRIRNPEKYFKYKRFEINCPGCRELIIPKSSFLGGFKCPLCKKNIPMDLIKEFLIY